MRRLFWAANPHHSPPLGSDGVGGQPGDRHQWMWSDGSVTLLVMVFRPGVNAVESPPMLPANAGSIIVASWPNAPSEIGLTCNRGP